MANWQPRRCKACGLQMRKHKTLRVWWSFRLGCVEFDRKVYEVQAQRNKGSGHATHND